MVAPAGPVPRDRFEAGLARLSSRYRAVYDEALFTRTGYLAGDDDRRADELNRYLRDPDVRAIVCARGGYGLLRILGRLDAQALAADPRPIVGFSDVTALLAWCVVSAGVRPVHGPVVTQLADLGDGDVEHLVRLLETPHAAGVVAHGLDCHGAHAGRLWGGNLELLTRLCGTPWQVSADGCLVFVEDVGERPYRVDRMLTHLQLAGGFDGASALVAGHFSRCEEPSGEAPDVLEVLAERARSFGLTLATGLPVGHSAPNLALPVGARASIDGGRLILEESAVS